MGQILKKLGFLILFWGLLNSVEMVLVDHLNRLSINLENANWSSFGRNFFMIWFLEVYKTFTTHLSTFGNFSPLHIFIKLLTELTKPRQILILSKSQLLHKVTPMNFLSKKTIFHSFILRVYLRIVSLFWPQFTLLQSYTRV